MTQTILYGMIIYNMKKVATVMLFICITCTFLLFSSFTACAQTNDPLATLYQKGLAREKLRSFDNAVLAYKACLTRAESVLNNSNTKLETIQATLPYAIAAAYRKGIVTHRFIESSLVKLNKQLNLYEEADIWIGEVLTTISNLQVEKKLYLQPQQYGLLYFARAYNALGWSYALLGGSSWKHYMVYAPANVVAMIDKEMDDLKQAQSSFNNLNLDDASFQTISLTLNITNEASLNATLKNIVQNSIKKTIETHASADVASALKIGSNIHSFEDFIKPETKPLFNALRELLRAIEIK